MIIGTVLHTILQITLNFQFKAIEYFYFREKKPLIDSIISVFNLIFSQWKTKLINKSKKGIISKDDLSEILDEIENQIPILADHCLSLIQIKQDSLYLDVVDDEFDVFLKLLIES